MTREAGTAPRKDHAWHLVLGLALWFAWFCATYGGLAAACSVAPPPPGAGPLTWLNAVALLVAAVCTAGLGMRARRAAGTRARGRRAAALHRALVRVALCHCRAVHRVGGLAGGAAAALRLSRAAAAGSQMPVVSASAAPRQ